MSPRTRVVIGLALVASFSAFGKATNIQRGGLGVLFPDHNSFANPGQFSVTHGIAVEGLYVRTNQSGGLQSVTPSVVFGNGRLGLGAFVNRIGTSFASSSSFDFAGVGAGFSLLKQRLTIGASYSTSLDGLAGSGKLKGSITLQSPTRQGPSLGAVIESTGSSKAGTIGVGYSFHSNKAMEANVRFNSFSDLSDFVASGFVNLASQALYLGAGYQYTNLGIHHAALARLGVVLGGNIDVSLYGGYAFASGSPVTYGGSFRASF